MTTMTSKEIFQQFAPSFNFEKSEDQLVELALERGFVSKIEGDNINYLVNEDY
jgi:hypothetical protein